MSQWNLIELKEVPIFEQLQLEEAILRAGSGNWLIINQQCPPAIVMGISGKSQELLNEETVNCPVIRRFSGGGTVYVDQGTLFVTFIGDNTDLPCQPYPRPLMEWTASIYGKAFEDESFGLRENDYTLGERKCAGNAQSLVRKRWLHHTTWLWNFDPTAMQVLKMPERQPKYRQQREHGDFLCTIEHCFDSPMHFFQAVKANLADAFVERQPSDLHDLLQQEHRRATRIESIGKKPAERVLVAAYQHGP